MQTSDLILKLNEIKAVQFGAFTLKSGMISPIYIDLRMIISYPMLLKTVAELIWDKIKAVECDLLCGVPYSAMPIATAISLSHDIPLIMRRKEVKEYGTRKAIEGAYSPGQRCLVIEDLITSGISIFETIEPLKSEGLLVTDVAVLIDRQQGGKSRLSAANIHLHSVLTMDDILETLLTKEKIERATYDKVHEFIEQNQTVTIG